MLGFSSKFFISAWVFNRWKWAFKYLQSGAPYYLVPKRNLIMHMLATISEECFLLIVFECNLFANEARNTISSSISVKKLPDLMHLKDGRLKRDFFLAWTTPLMQCKN